MGILDAFQRFDTLTAQYQSNGFTSSSAPPGSSRFAAAVVSCPSTDFIRAASAAQTAVYSISQTNFDKPGELEKAEIKRKIVALATPLRKGVSETGNAAPRSKKPRKSKVALVLNPENDPEVPLRAALKLIDLYPTGVPTGLRQDILDKIKETQDQSNRITELLKPKQQDRGDEEDSGRVHELEEEIRALEAEYARARQKVDDMMKAKAAQQFAEADESMESEASPLVQRSGRKFDRQHVASHKKDLAAALREADDDATTDFKNLNLSDASLLMESDTPDISQLMAQTPMKLNASGGWDRPQHVPLAALAQRAREVGRKPAPPRTPPRRDDESSIEETPRAGYTFEAEDLGDESLAKDEQPTIMFQTAEPGREEEISVQEEDLAQEEVKEERTEPDSSVSDSPVKPEDSIRSDHPPSIYSQRMREFNLKIWSIAGDTLCPGHNYDIGKGSGTQPAPILRETNIILQSIVDESGSVASSEEAFRILTAKILLYLIKRDASTVENPDDAFSSGMNEAKEVLNALAEENGWKKDTVSKVIFTWVGKKLLKSEGGRKLRCNLD